MSAVVAELLRLMHSNLSTSLDRSCKKFSAESFLLSYSSLLSIESFVHFHCKFSFVIVAIRLGNFTALLT